MARQTSAHGSQAAESVLGSLRVLELADEKGHYCGKLLADMGADVIKIEPPGGDTTRSCGPFVDDKPDADRSLYFWHFNTSKRAVTLALETTEGKELFRRLVQSADVLLETFEPGYLAGLGLGYNELARLNPGLVMASITPFGQTGPYRNFKTSALVSSAMSGIMFSCGYDDQPGSPPVNPDGEQAFHAASIYGAVAILAAVCARQHTGRGQQVDISIHEAGGSITEWDLPTYFYFGKNVQRQTGRHAADEPTAPWQFLCRDGRYVNLMAVLPREEASWRKLLDWMEERGAIGDLREPRYADAGGKARAGAGSWRTIHKTPEGRHMMEMVSAFVQSLDSNEVYHGSQQRGMQWSVIRAPDEVLEDEHLRDRGFFVSVSYPELGKEFTHPGAPYIFSKTPVRLVRRAPLVGEHNQEVYRHELGLSPEDISALVAKGVL